MTTAPQIRRVLHIACEGLDAPLFQAQSQAGNLPNLAKLAANGCSGPLNGIDPILPPALWTSVATGQRPQRHGVLGAHQIHDQALAPVGSETLRVPTWWQTLAERGGAPTHSFGWPASHPLKQPNGASVSDRFALPKGRDLDSWPLLDGSTFPTESEGDFKELRLHPTELTANDLASMIPEIAEIGLKEDPRPWHLACALSQSISIHAAATFQLQQGADWQATTVFLPGLGPILAEFLPYHPPQAQEIPSDEYERYHRVVVAVLQLHDQMIGTLIAMAGEETLSMVTSGYGLAAGADRIVSAAGEHHLHIEQRRTTGFALIGGPGVPCGESLFSAHILDIAPTALAALAQPIPHSMLGRVWVEAFEPAPNIQKEASAPPELADISAWPLSAAPCEDTESPAYQAWLADAQNLYHLALFDLDQGKFETALPPLENICQVQPWRLRPMLDRVRCLTQLRRYSEARELLETAAQRAQGGLKFRDGLQPKFLPQYDMMRSVIDLAEGKFEDALRHLNKTRTASPQLTGYHAQLGKIHLRLGQHEQAVRALKIATRNGAASAETYCALAEACLALKDNQAAADAAFAATELAPEADAAHFFLGMALANLGETHGAITALKNALSRNQKLAPAHQILSVLYAKNPQTKALADMHAIAARLNSQP